MDNENTPRKPVKPPAEACCGGNCSPCIWDYYFDELAKWKKAQADELAIKVVAKDKD